MPLSRTTDYRLWMLMLIQQDAQLIHQLSSYGEIYVYCLNTKVLAAPSPSSGSSFLQYYTILSYSRLLLNFTQSSIFRPLTLESYISLNTRFTLSMVYTLPPFYRQLYNYRNRYAELLKVLPVSYSTEISGLAAFLFLSDYLKDLTPALS